MKTSRSKDIIKGKNDMIVVVCLVFLSLSIAIIGMLINRSNVFLDSDVGDIAPMICVNGTVYKQSTVQSSYADLPNNSTYLGEVKTNIAEKQNNSDGVPREEYQANHAVVGAKIYKYGDDIAVLINGRYWLYEYYGNVE